MYLVYKLSHMIGSMKQERNKSSARKKYLIIGGVQTVERDTEGRR